MAQDVVLEVYKTVDLLIEKSRWQKPQRSLRSLQNCRPAYLPLFALAPDSAVLEVYKTVDLLILGCGRCFNYGVLEVYKTVDLLIFLGLSLGVYEVLEVYKTVDLLIVNKSERKCVCES